MDDKVIPEVQEPDPRAREATLPARVGEVQPPVELQPDRPPSGRGGRRVRLGLVVAAVAVMALAGAGYWYWSSPGVPVTTYKTCLLYTSPSPRD